MIDYLKQLLLMMFLFRYFVDLVKYLSLPARYNPSWLIVWSSVSVDLVKYLSLPTRYNLSRLIIWSSDCWYCFYFASFFLPVDLVKYLSLPTRYNPSWLIDWSSDCWYCFYLLSFTIFFKLFLVDLVEYLSLIASV